MPPEQVDAAAQSAIDLKNEEWVLPDHEFVDELDAVHEPASRPRGPDGKFLPAKAAETTLTEPIPTKHVHTSRVVRMATDLGISQAQIDATPPEQLDEEVYYRNNERLNLLERERRLAPAVGSPQAGAPGAPTPSPTTPPEPEDELDELGDLKESLDPRFAGLLRKLVKENRELKAQVGEVRGIEQRRRNESRDQWVDRLFDENADELKFGRKSAGKGLTADQQMRRQQIVQAAALKAGPKASEKQILELIPAVLKDLFGDVPAEQGGRNGNSRVSREEWDDAALLRPTQRARAQEPKGTRRAERAVMDTLREMNVPLDDEGGIEEAGLPD